MKILALVLTVVLVLGLTLTGCSSNGATDGEESPEVGKLAPTFTLQDTNGNTVSLKELRGSPVMINFWATWCVPCGEEMPYLQEIYDIWTSRGLVFLSVDTGEGADKVRDYLTERSLTFPVLLDSDQEVALKQYGLMYLPTTVLVDRDGVILAMPFGGFVSRQQIETELLSLVFPDM
ncbi:TlpA family protein disulfide reductase [Chloroflexota bacterium]